MPICQDYQYGYFSYRHTYNVYWYGRPMATLIGIQQVQIGCTLGTETGICMEFNRNFTVTYSGSLCIYVIYSVAIFPFIAFN